MISLLQEAFAETAIEEVVLPLKMKFIGRGTFKNCELLKNVDMSQTNIINIPAYAFSNDYQLSNVRYPTYLDEIDDGAFMNTGLTRVTVPSGLTKIHEMAFMNCTQIRIADLSRTKLKIIGSRAFSGATGLYSVTLPSSVRSVGSGAFNATAISDFVFPITLELLNASVLENCKLLQVADLSKTQLTSIGEKAFFGCVKLVTVTFPESITSIAASAFGATSLTIFTGTTQLKTLGNSVLAGCSFLISVDLSMSNRLNTIPDHFCLGCGKLANVAIPSSIIEIGNGAFSQTVLTALEAKQTNIQKIGDEAFRDSSLERVELPETVRSIGQTAFAGTNLNKFTCPPKVTELGSFALSGCRQLSSVDLSEFSGTSISSSLCFNSSLKEVLIPMSITEIGSGAFMGTSLQSVLIPKRCQSIGSFAFANCPELRSIDLGNTAVNVINESAFANCIKLVNVSLCTRIKLIGANAFINCQSLESIGIDATVTTSIGAYAFAHCLRLKEADLPGHIEEIGASAFMNTSIRHVHLRRDFKTMGSYCFASCHSLEEADFHMSQMESLPEAVLFDTPKLQKIVFPQQMKGVGKLALHKAGITELTLPDSVVQLGNYSFSNSRLRKIDLGQTKVTKLDFGCFLQCADLKELKLPDKLTSIDGRAFFECAIDEIRLPATLNRLGSEAFAKARITSIDLSRCLITEIPDGCFIGTNLTDVKLPPVLKAVGSNAFFGTMIKTFKPDELGAIRESALANCPLLESVDLSTCSLKKIPKALVHSSKNLKSLNPPSKLEEFEDSALAVCALTSFELPDTVTKAGTYLLAGSPNLVSINMALCDIKEIPMGFAFQCSKLEKIDLPPSVTSIGESAFCGTAIVTFPFTERITRIGDMAFSMCGDLRSVNLKQCHEMKQLGSRAFIFCVNVTEIQLPASLEDIGEYAFASTGISSFTASPTLKSIGEGVFAACHNLKEADISTIPELTKVPSSLFEECINLKTVTLPQEINSIGSDAFSNTGFEKFEFPGTITYIGSSAMSQCQELQSVDLSKTDLSVIPEALFENCTRLKFVQFPPNLREIGAFAFENAAVEEYIAPSSLEKLGDGAFKGSKIASIDLSKSTVNELPNEALSNCLSLKSVIAPTIQKLGKLALANTALKSFALTESILSVGEFCFMQSKLQKLDLSAFAGDIPPGLAANCSDLSDVVFNMGVKLIGAEAFAFTGLLNFTVPPETVEIGVGAFRGCQELKSIYAARPLERIREYAFCGCSYLQDVDFTSFISIGAHSFAGTGIKEVVASRDTKGLGEGAFEDCLHLKYADLSQAFFSASIPSRLFAGCTLLKWVALPTASTDSARNAGVFEKCAGLRTISYCGSSVFVNIDVPEKAKVVVSRHYPKTVFGKVMPSIEGRCPAYSKETDMTLAIVIIVVAAFVLGGLFGLFGVYIYKKQRAKYNALNELEDIPRA